MKIIIMLLLTGARKTDQSPAKVSTSKLVWLWLKARFVIQLCSAWNGMVNIWNFLKEHAPGAWGYILDILDNIPG